MGKRKVVDVDIELPASEKGIANTDARLTAAELRERNDQIVQIDLHGFDAASAETLVVNFLERLIKEKIDFGRIIHGKGSGKLAEVVKQTVEVYRQRGLVEALLPSAKKGLEGAAVVVIMANID